MAYEEFDPFAELPEDDTESDVSILLDRLGWEGFFDLGDEDGVYLYVQTYRRTVDGKAEFLLGVSDANWTSPYLRVDTFVEIMDLLTRWGPAVQAASVTSLISDIRRYGLKSDGIVEVIAAKAAHGAETGLDALRRHEREQAEYRRRAKTPRAGTN